MRALLVLAKSAGDLYVAFIPSPHIPHRGLTRIRRTFSGVSLHGGQDARSRVPAASAGRLRLDGGLRCLVRETLRGNAMTDPILGLLVAIGLGVYLVFTLLRPEKF